MNWKAVVLGAIVFWLVTNILGMAGTGILIHQKILDPIYQANESFWLPELRQDPPDMAALMPRWMLVSFISSLIVAGIYAFVLFMIGGAAMGWATEKWGGLES